MVPKISPYQRNSAASVDGSILLEANAPDKAPVNGKPEKPDPSNPVIIPLIKVPNQAKIFLF
jgi:hypothetical protein